MTPKRRSAPLIFVAIAFVGIVGSPATVEPADRAQVTIQIRWAEPADTTTLADSIDRLRITSETTVSVRVTHFNFLHYALQYAVEAKEVESYQLLNTLWSQLLGFFPVPEAVGAAGAVSDFERELVAWRRKLAAVDENLTALLGKYAARRALTDADVASISAAIATAGTGPLAAIETQRRLTLSLAETSAELDLYERIAAQHQTIQNRLSSFITSAGLVRSGETHVIGRRNAGTRITLTVQPVDARESPAGAPVQVSYFVRSTYPLAFHLGYAAGRLTDVEFDKVRSLSGNDLFVATKENDTTQALAAFMSYELWNWGSAADVGLQATLGTSVPEPGSTFYVGGGVRLLRFVISAGAVSRDVAEGRQLIIEGLGTAAGARELFATIARRRDWGPFLSASVRVF
jgi:hypothetical protein